MDQIEPAGWTGGGRTSFLLRDLHAVRLNLPAGAAGCFQFFGKLPRLAFGNSFEVPSEVVVQRFFCLDYGHCHHQIPWGTFYPDNHGDSLCVLIESLPRKNRSNCF
jgi:hypothetical protein